MLPIPRMARYRWTSGRTNMEQDEVTLKQNSINQN
jgi:hypothetical protein